ncbi:hypothetical protein CLV78_10652 [Aliiruegeria haliotis]|uniref:Uncharacterized protein n=1 Tax=Aliiruegeria haliotis TaxID=1280846 RepID=A0A2T0RN11_9RHOB|nr:hypothetical protein [Aliiruegeria haliotis]PRY22512.1 hypothetical protein CLV78_10652 [Aliiruegeria haliotis]
MLDFLNPLGLPIKYAIIGAIACPFGVFLAGLLGFGATGYIPTMVGGAIGGAVGGYIRKRRGKAR